MARKLAFESLFVAIFIDSFSYALILPTLPFLALQYGAGAEFGGILVASHALAAAVSAPLLGWLSDRLGKRVVICWTIAGSLFSYIVFATSRSLGTVWVTRILAGVMAGNMGVVQAAAAADATAEQQGRAMRLLTVAWAMGFVVGPAVTSLIPGNPGAIAFWPGVVAATACAASLLLTVLLPDRGQSARAGSQVAASARGKRNSRFPLVRAELLALLGMVALSQTGLVSMIGFWGHSTFAWGAQQVSLLFLWVAAGLIAVQLFVLPRLVARFDESMTLLVAAALSSGSCAAVLLNPRSVYALLFSAPLMFAGITITQTVATTSILQLTSHRKHGVVMGAANSVTAMSRVAGPIICGALFARLDPTAPYWLVAIIFAVCLTWLTLRNFAQSPRGRLRCQPRRR